MYDINTPVTNPELVAAIEAVREQTNADTQNAYFTALKNARFLSPVTIDPRPEPSDEDGATTLKADTTINFLCIADANGDNYLPVFTDWPALKQWRDIPDEQTLITTFNDIRTVVSQDADIAGFVLNPFSHNIPIRQDMIDRINAGLPNHWTVDKDTTVLIGLPADDPVALKDAVIEHLASQKNVRAAWLVLMEKDGERSFVIVVNCTGGSHATFNGIASVAVPKLRDGEILDMVTADSAIGQQVVHDYPAFYERTD